MNSKKWLLLLLMSLGVNNNGFSQPFTCSSHMYVPRGISTDLVYINSLLFNERHTQVENKAFTYAGQFIFQNSRKSRALGAAFLTGTNNTITVQQAPFAPGTPATIDALSLGLANADPANPFLETFSISPQRKVFAYHGYFYLNLDAWWCGLWADVAFAIVNARHSLHCEQTGNTSSLCANIATVSDALSTQSLTAGRFFCGPCNDEKRRTGFDDLQIRLGYDYNWCDNVFGLYLIGTVPGGRKPNAVYVFEPLVGSRHGSLGVGLQAFVPFNLCGCEDTALTLLSDFNYRYVFSHRECRTFDLLPNGPFSRFAPVVDLANPLLTFPAANVLTGPVKVQPRSTIQWWLGVNYEFCDWNFEVGYNLYWRQRERIQESSVVVPANIGIFDVTTATSSAAITAANIDINSAVAARALTNKIYGAFSFNGCVCDCFEWMSGFGGSYEFVAKRDRCAALSNWAIFGKCAVSF